MQVPFPFSNDRSLTITMQIASKKMAAFFEQSIVMVSTFVSLRHGIFECFCKGILFYVYITSM